MIELSAMILGQTIGVLLWSSLLNAPILQWRARTLKNWNISYKNAYFVSIKSGFMALIIGDAAVLSIALSGNAREQWINLVGFIIGATSWWFAHSNALLKLAGPTGILTVKDARSVSASVFGYLIGSLFALVLVVALIASAVSMFK